MGDTLSKKLIISLILFIIIVCGLVIFLEVHKGKSGSKTLELTYKTSAGVPYEWTYEIKDKSIVTLDESFKETVDYDKNIKGGPVYVHYVFKGLKKGVTTITFKYVSIVDNEISKEETVKVKVDKYKNISLMGM